LSGFFQRIFSFAKYLNLA